MSASFDEFFKDHYEPVVRRLVGRGCDAELASDCAQEAFVRAYGRWPLVRRYRSPEAWVVRVARNLEIDEYRRVERGRKHHRIMADSVRAGVAAGGVSRPQPDGAERAADGIDIDRALDELPTRQQQAARLFYLDGESTEDGAARLGISGGAFRFHLTRARSSLRTGLAVDGEGDGVDDGVGV